MSMTRRELLENSMWATASAAALAFTPKPLAAAPAKLGANEILRVAVVGVKGRGTAHLSEFAAMKDVQVAAIVDIDEGVVEPALKIVERKGGKKHHSKR